MKTKVYKRNFAFWLNGMKPVQKAVADWLTAMRNQRLFSVTMRDALLLAYDRLPKNSFDDQTLLEVGAASTHVTSSGEPCG